MVNEILKFLVLIVLLHPMFVGMDGGITLEICNGELVCCNSGKLDSPRYINKEKNVFKDGIGV